MAPCTTRVVNVAFGPSTASAATEVTSLVVEAGVRSRVPSCDSSTRPVAGSATTADTWGPSAAADSGPARADRSPLAVGSEPPPVAGASTVPAPSDPARRDGRDPQGREPRREHAGHGDARREREHVDHGERQHGR